MGHVQLEPAYGRHEDTAAPLRAESAFGLIACRGIRTLEVLRRLTDLVADPEKMVRVAAVRAIAALGALEGGLLLRLKLRVGDESPEVTGACCSALVAIEAEEGIPLVARLLESPDEDIPYEAAAALGESARPEAFRALQAAWLGARDPRFRRALLLSMGSSRSEEAMEFLLSLIVPGDLAAAADAVAALAPHRFSGPVRERVSAAVARLGSEAVTAGFRQAFHIERP